MATEKTEWMKCQMRASNWCLETDGCSSTSHGNSGDQSFVTFMYLRSQSALPRTLPVGVLRIRLSSNYHFKHRWVNLPLTLAMETQHLSLNDLTHEVEHFNVIVWKEINENFIALAIECFSRHFKASSLFFDNFHEVELCHKLAGLAIDLNNLSMKRKKMSVEI